MTVLADQIDVARAVRIEDELARRGIPFWTKPRNNNLGQPCPMCGGADRFSVNTRKQVWRCRACNESGGDIISLAVRSTARVSKRPWRLLPDLPQKEQLAVFQSNASKP
jgi:Zinc-binding domain of primase-helicase